MTAVFKKLEKDFELHHMEIFLMFSKFVYACFLMLKKLY